MSHQPNSRGLYTHYKDSYIPYGTDEVVVFNGYGEGNQ